jgi:hypothetical protein
MFILSDVKYVPGLWKNLFSFGQALKEGDTLESLGENMIMKKGKAKIAFQDTTENGIMGILFTSVADEALYTTPAK